MTEWKAPESIPFAEVEALLDSLSVAEHSGDVWNTVQWFCERNHIPFEEDEDRECYYFPWSEREDDD